MKDKDKQVTRGPRSHGMSPGQLGAVALHMSGQALHLRESVSSQKIDELAAWQLLRHGMFCLHLSRSFMRFWLPYINGTQLKSDISHVAYCGLEALNACTLHVSMLTTRPAP